jgi:bacillithiol biosynthesis cysteine-adding enzyme BshC
LETKLDLRADYLSGAPALRPFYKHALQGARAAELIAARSAFPIDRGLLVQELRAQNAALPHAAATLAHIEALAHPDTYTVTTGHQLCLLGGPMYTIYKITTAIRLAADLSAEGQRVVPVFWMATEDHDWEEVNHYYPEATRKQGYAAAHQGPVGRHVITEAISAAWTEAVPAEFRDFFRPGVRLADAFRAFVHHLFGDQGLVIIDGDSPALKAAFSPILVAELMGNGFADQVKATTQALEAAGYSPQIKTRDINLFYMGHGGRSGVQRKGDRIVVPEAGIDWSVEEALAHAQARPEDFSPNVALRPVYQELLLPNLAYIGGWAEMTYWMQLQAGFRAVSVAFPLLLPRMSATLYTASQATELSALGLGLTDLSESTQALQERYLSAHWDPAPFDAHGEAILDAYARLADYLDGQDPTLGTSLRGERARVQSSFENLGKKLRKALRNKDPKPYARIAALKSMIVPEQEIQERLLNLTAFPTPYPVILETVRAQCHPLDLTPQWIQLP